MKRTWIFVALLVAFCGATDQVQARVAKPLSTITIELPWTTVQAVLKRCAEVTTYSYTSLLNGYQSGLVAVNTSGSAFLVSVCNADGLLDAIIIDLT
jgi:hypothetical protein